MLCWDFWVHSFSRQLTKGNEQPSLLIKWKDISPQGCRIIGLYHFDPFVRTGFKVSIGWGRRKRVGWLDRVSWFDYSKNPNSLAQAAQNSPSARTKRKKGKNLNGKKLCCNMTTLCTNNATLCCTLTIDRLKSKQELKGSLYFEDCWFVNFCLFFSKSTVTTASTWKQKQTKKEKMTKNARAERTNKRIMYREAKESARSTEFQYRRVFS